jgi:hypothetical protein
MKLTVARGAQMGRERAEVDEVDGDTRMFAMFTLVKRDCGRPKASLYPRRRSQKSHSLRRVRASVGADNDRRDFPAAGTQLRMGESPSDWRIGQGVTKNGRVGQHIF